MTSRTADELRHRPLKRKRQLGAHRIQEGVSQLPVALPLTQLHVGRRRSRVRRGGAPCYAHLRRSPWYAQHLAHRRRVQPVVDDRRGERQHRLFETQETASGREAHVGVGVVATFATLDALGHEVARILAAHRALPARVRLPPLGSESHLVQGLVHVRVRPGDTLASAHWSVRMCAHGKAALVAAAAAAAAVDGDRVQPHPKLGIFRGNVHAVVAQARAPPCVMSERGQRNLVGARNEDVGVEAGARVTVARRLHLDHQMRAHVCVLHAKVRVLELVHEAVPSLVQVEDERLGERAPSLVFVRRRRVDWLAADLCLHVAERLVPAVEWRAPAVLVDSLEAEACCGPCHVRRLLLGVTPRVAIQHLVRVLVALTLGHPLFDTALQHDHRRHYHTIA